jgi:glycosyltransferase involved in cell wall biosynthesis
VPTFFKNMPKIVNLNSYHYRRGGADVMYFEHESLMREKGWDTAFFAMHYPENLESSWSEYFVDEIQYGHAYGLMAKARMAGKIIYSMEARAKLAALLDNFSADVAHSHNLYHHISPSVLGLLKDRGIPSVMTAHDLKLVCPAREMLAPDGICERCKGGNLIPCFTNNCMKGSKAISLLVTIESTIHQRLGLYRNYLDKVIVPSRFYAQKLQEWGWPASQLAYVPNFIYPDRFKPDYAPGDYFVYFGRLAESKGVMTLIKAAIQSGVRLKLIGTGDLDAQVRDSIRGHEHIEFMGRRTGEELFSLVRGARACVLPSEWYENAPMSVLESFALGKPVIGARIGGIPELIEDQVNGWLFESGHVDDLTRVLQQAAIASDSTIAEMGRSCRTKVESHFSPAAYVDGILNVYQSIGVRGIPA